MDHVSRRIQQTFHWNSAPLWASSSQFGSIGKSKSYHLFIFSTPLRIISLSGLFLCAIDTLVLCFQKHYSLTLCNVPVTGFQPSQSEYSEIDLIPEESKTPPAVCGFFTFFVFMASTLAHRKRLNHGIQDDVNGFILTLCTCMHPRCLVKHREPSVKH